MSSPPVGLPTEILQKIGKNVTSLRTLRALACANHLFNAIFDPILYYADARRPLSAAIAWAAEHGAMEILQKALGYGAQIAPMSTSAGEISTNGMRISYGWL
jgi:hypothetical protein